MKTNLIQTQELAINLAKKLKKGDIVCLYGNLGSGKTTFTKALAQGLGIKKRIISPTFIIIRHHKTSKLIFYHIDLYRIETITDLIELGIDEILSDKNNIIVIEWAEKLGSLLPMQRIDVKFDFVDAKTRNIEIKSYE